MDRIESAARITGEGAGDDLVGDVNVLLDCSNGFESQQVGFGKLAPFPPLNIEL